MDAFQVLRIAGFGYTFVSQSEAAGSVINTLTISFFNYAVMRAALGTKLTISGLVGTQETEEASDSRILMEVPAASSKLATVASSAGPFVLDSDISKASGGAFPIGYYLQIRSERRQITSWDAASKTVEVKAGLAYSFLPSVGEAVSVRADFHAPFGNVGQWNRTAGTLILDVQADSLAETIYTFKFEVRNPAITSDAVDVYITSSKTFSPLWLLAAATGRNAPLMVIGLVHRHIGQSTAKPGATNTITITVLVALVFLRPWHASPGSLTCRLPRFLLFRFALLSSIPLYGAFPLSLSLADIHNRFFVRIPGSAGARDRADGDIDGRLGSNSASGRARQR